jgi:hypothetical protein
MGKLISKLKLNQTTIIWFDLEPLPVIFFHQINTFKTHTWLSSCQPHIQQHHHRHHNSDKITIPLLIHPHYHMDTTIHTHTPKSPKNITHVYDTHQFYDTHQHLNNLDFQTPPQHYDNPLTCQLFGFLPPPPSQHQFGFSLPQLQLGVEYGNSFLQECS